MNIQNITSLRPALIKTSFAAAIGLLSAGEAQAGTLRVGPGETHTKIQDALTFAAGPAGSSYNRIKVEEGVYQENLVIKRSNLKLSASGDVVIEARGLGGVGGGAGITVEGSDVTIEGFIIRNAKYGFNSAAGTFGQWQDGYGVLGKSAGTTLILEDCSLVGNEASGLQLSAKDAVIEDCSFRGNGEYGIYALSGATDLLVKKCEILTSGSHGIYVLDNDAKIKKTTVSRAGGDGIHIEGDDADVYKCDVEGVTGSAIDVDGDNFEIGKNDCVGSEKYGIVVTNCSVGSIFDNDVSKTLKSGIVVFSGAESVTVSDNKVTHSWRHGFYLEGKDAIVTENTAKQNAQDGFIILAKMTLTDNKAKNNAKDGFDVEENRTVTLEGNQAKDNAAEGFDLSQAAPNVLLVDNKATGNRIDYGVHSTYNMGSSGNTNDDGSVEALGSSPQPEID